MLTLRLVGGGRLGLYVEGAIKLVGVPGHEAGVGMDGWACAGYGM